MTACLMLFSGCAKEKTNKNYSELIVGTWNVLTDKSYELYTESDGYEEMTYISQWASSLTLTFTADGKLEYSAMLGEINDAWTDNYTLEGDTVVWEPRKYAIVQLDEDHFVMQSTRSDERTNAGGNTMTSSEVKRYEMERI